MVLNSPGRRNKVVLVFIVFLVIGVDVVGGAPNSFVHTDSFVPLEPIFRKTEQEHRVADDGEAFVAVWVFCVWGTGALECFP